MNLTAIIESGSTKSDWVLVNEQTQKLFLNTTTIGLNPLFISAEEIQTELNKNTSLKKHSSAIEKIFFYGAGIRKGGLPILSSFQAFFCNAKITIQSDLMAACIATCHNHKGIVAILGTGSNSCYFDGKTISEITPSLGYILGDEGSGNHLGRELLRDFFSHKIPTSLEKEFIKTFNLNKESVIEKVYRANHANRYLASFNPFIYKYRESAYIQSLLLRCFHLFFEYHIIPYSEKEIRKIHFVGSIAHCYKDTLNVVAKKYDFEVGKILSKPIENLVIYHTLSPSL